MDSHLECSERTLDSWIVKTSILRELRSAIPRFKGTMLDVGSGDMPYRDLVLTPPSLVRRYIGMDVVNASFKAPDVVWDGVNIPLGEATMDCAMATEVLEHCPDPQRVLTEIRRVLKPGGVVFITTPFLWPLHLMPYDEYRYTPCAMERMFRQAGFVGVAVRAMGGWDAALAQMLGLWCRRRPMPSLKKRLISRLIVPVVKALVKRDVVPMVFEDGVMLTGLSVVAEAP
jgi:SAM-dependent methyltransferase